MTRAGEGLSSSVSFTFISNSEPGQASKERAFRNLSHYQRDTREEKREEFNSMLNRQVKSSNMRKRTRNPPLDDNTDYNREKCETAARNEMRLSSGFHVLLQMQLNFLF